MKNYRTHIFLVGVFILFSNKVVTSTEITTASFATPTVIQTSGSILEMNDMEFHLFGLSDSPALSVGDLLSNASDSDLILKLTDTPLNFPNPFRNISGTEMQYTLNKDATIDFLLFNLAARQVLKKTFPSGFPGGSSGPNHVSLTGSEMSGLPAGLYYYLLLADGSVLGKGKMVLLP